MPSYSGPLGRPVSPPRDPVRTLYPLYLPTHLHQVPTLPLLVPSPRQLRHCSVSVRAVTSKYLASRITTSVRSLLAPDPPQAIIFPPPHLGFLFYCSPPPLSPDLRGRFIPLFFLSSPVSFLKVFPNKRVYSLIWVSAGPATACSSLLPRLRLIRCCHTNETAAAPTTTTTTNLTRNWDCLGRPTFLVSSPSLRSLRPRAPKHTHPSCPCPTE